MLRRVAPASANGEKAIQRKVYDLGGADGVPFVANFDLPEGWTVSYNACLSERFQIAVITCGRRLTEGA